MSRRLCCLILGLALLAATAAGCSTRDPTRRAVPVYEDVEMPVRTRKAVPAHRIRFVPQYETVEETIRGRLQKCRRFAGYEPEQVQIGWRWKTVEEDTRTVRVLRGWRYADDPPWSCEATETSPPAPSD